MINIPFPPKFILKCAELLYPNFDYHLEQAHTDESISNFWSDRYDEKEQRDKDILRTHWQLGADNNNKVMLHAKNINDTSIFKTANDSSLALSEKEVKALYAFHATSAALLHKNESYLQGGFFGVTRVMAQLWANATIGPHQTETQNDKPINGIVTRTNNQQLNVATDYNTVGSSDNNALISQYKYVIAEKKGKYYATLDDRYEFKVNQTEWDDTIPNVIHSIKKSAKWTNNELFLFIPCLCEPTITEVFAQKLAQQSLEIKTMAADLIDLCFEHRKEDREWIKMELYATEHITSLKKACANYLAYLQPKNGIASPETWEKLPRLAQSMNYLDDPASLSNAQRIAKFAEHFEKNEAFYKKGADSTERKLIKAIHIILSVVTLGLYAGIAAGISHVTRGSPKFWQSRDEIFTEAAAKAAGILHKKRKS